MLKPAHKKQIENAISQLNRTLARVQKYEPDANYYLEDCGNFHLLSGAPHDEKYKPGKDRVMLHCHLDDAGGGGW